MPHRQRLVSYFVSALLASSGGASLVSAQSREDTLTIVTAISDVIVHEARRGGDHHGPFVLIESSSFLWGRAVAAELRARHSDLVASPVPHALDLTVDDVRMLGDTASATLLWSRCTERVAALNYWQHVVTYGFARSGGGWRFTGRRAITFADGHC